MYFCMASRRCETVVVGWYVGTLGIGICKTEDLYNCMGIVQTQYSQEENADLSDSCALLYSVF